MFELKKSIPCGIMINGIVDFENIPLETLIAEFNQNTKDFDNVKDIKNDFITYLSKNTPHTSTSEYLKPIISSFKTKLIELIHDDGFENTINNKTRKKIPEFVRKYPNFKNEFNELIPNDKNKRHYNKLNWEIFSFELTFEGTGIIIA